MSKTCLIIGAAGGIGRALCARLSESGWNMILAGRNSEPLRELADETSSEVEVLDASDFDAVNTVFDRHDAIIGAVNLAGSILLKPAHLTTEDDFEQTVSLNLRTAFSLVRAAGKSMRDAGGSVVLMSSCAASIGIANHEAIAAAKAGIEGLARAAAASYANCNLRFNAVAPGLTDTPMAQKLVQDPATRKASEAMHPLGRIGTADEVARCIEFLLAPESSWITGQILGVDGGFARVRTRTRAGS